MITFLRGILQDNLSSQIAVDVNGVGYEVIVPLSTLDRLGPAGNSVFLLTHLHIREQEHTLYGFLSPEERDLFRLLINRVSGVGPKVALSILGGMSVSAFKTAVVQGDLALLSKVKGVGRRTAERIVLELKDKVGVTEAWKAASSSHPPTEDQRRQTDAILALISLGYKQAEAAKAVSDCVTILGPSTSVEDLVRKSLAQLQ
ncbi:MAG: Holliday junction branch migration protein RuvA [Verrucomicrobia bacterium]|nr:Holliday junction branch migration protein RuvA [Verrucomicrobiota bacterium]